MCSSDLRNVFESAGIPVKSCWAMGSSFDELMCAGKARVNVAVSACGLPVARRLKEIYGTPYAAGLPIGKSGAAALIAAVEKACSCVCFPLMRIELIKARTFSLSLIHIFSVILLACGKINQIYLFPGTDTCLCKQYNGNFNTAFFIHQCAAPGKL